jgi:hypothetical protein
MAVSSVMYPLVVYRAISNVTSIDLDQSRALFVSLLAQNDGAYETAATIAPDQKCSDP